MGKRVCLKFKKSLVEQIRKGLSYASINGQYRTVSEKVLRIWGVRIWKTTVFG